MTNLMQLCCVKGHAVHIRSHSGDDLTRRGRIKILARSKKMIACAHLSWKEGTALNARHVQLGLREGSIVVEGLKRTIVTIRVEGSKKGRKKT